MFILGLGILNIPRQWLLIEAKIQRMKNLQRFFWYNISNDISDFVKKCEQCQKQGDLKSPKADLKPIPIPSTVMKQVGVDICSLTETDGYGAVVWWLSLLHNFIQLIRRVLEISDGEDL